MTSVTTQQMCVSAIHQHCRSSPQPHVNAGTTIPTRLKLNTDNPSARADLKKVAKQQYRFWKATGIPDGNKWKVGGYSLHFDANDDYAYVPTANVTNGTLWRQTKTEFSIAFWVYPTAYGFETSDMRFLTHSNDFNIFLGGFAGEARGVRFWVHSNTAAIYGGGGVGLGTEIKELHRWYHFVFTVKMNGGAIKMYMDGVQATGDTNLPNETIGVDIADENFYISAGTSTVCVNGNMKDIRWWNREITQQEVNDVKDNLLTAPTPDFWLKLEEGTGNPADSIASIGAILVNGTTWNNTVQNTV